MAIYINNKRVKDVYLNNKAIKQVYINGKPVWRYKFVSTTNDWSTCSAKCDDGIQTLKFQCYRYDERTLNYPVKKPLAYCPNDTTNYYYKNNLSTAINKSTLPTKSNGSLNYTDANDIRTFSKTCNNGPCQQAFLFDTYYDDCRCLAYVSSHKKASESNPSGATRDYTIAGLTQVDYHYGSHADKKEGHILIFKTFPAKLILQVKNVDHHGGIRNTQNYTVKLLSPNAPVSTPESREALLKVDNVGYEGHRKVDDYVIKTTKVFLRNESGQETGSCDGSGSHLRMILYFEINADGTIVRKNGYSPVNYIAPAIYTKQGWGEAAEYVITGYDYSRVSGPNSDYADMIRNYGFTFGTSKAAMSDPWGYNWFMLSLRTSLSEPNAGYPNNWK